MSKNRQWADAIIDMLNETRKVDLADIDFSSEWEVSDSDYLPIEPKYDFETYVRPWDNVVVESVTGIPADEFRRINLPEKFKEDPMI